MANTRIVVLGARGSIPVSGPGFVRYGGNTTCFAVVSDETVIAFIDAGTGLVSRSGAGLELPAAVGIFLSHYHWDHIQGISMLDELWRGACDIHVWGPGDPRSILVGAIRPPWFPVAIEDVPSIHYSPMDEPVELGGITFSSFDVNHPQGAIGYRIDGPNRSIGIVTDHESAPDADDQIRKSLAGIDALVHDAQYLPSETVTHRGWGHSTCEDAVRMGNALDVEQLILTSHDPSRTDDVIDEMVGRIEGEFPGVIAAFQGLEISL
jgi:phosphoribosyl 1,2-cyclic phosphodiesterase